MQSITCGRCKYGMNLRNFTAQRNDTKSTSTAMKALLAMSCDLGLHNGRLFDSVSECNDFVLAELRDPDWLEIDQRQYGDLWTLDIQDVQRWNGRT